MNCEEATALEFVKLTSCSKHLQLLILVRKIMAKQLIKFNIYYLLLIPKL